MSSWLKEYIDSCSELESPQNYFYWSMLTTISSVLGRKMWVNRGDVYKLYPNVYTFLISKKSGLRKGIPVSHAKKLAYDVGKVRVIDGQNSIQGVLKELAQVRTVGQGHIIKNAEGFLITGEFASFLLQDGVGFSLTTLTDLYDTQYHNEGFKKRLSSQDELSLKAPCLTALFASNETHFFNTIPLHAINGGFLARTFCICESQRNTINSLTKPIKKKIDYLKLTEHLFNISRLEGEFKITEGANIVFNTWYHEFCGADQEDETGTAERLGDNIWKAAMLICLANGHYTYIEENMGPITFAEILESDMAEAIYKTVETFNGLKRILIGGPSDTKNVKSIVMRTTVAMILETEPIFEANRKMILRKGAGMFGVYDLDECIEHLLQAGMIKIDKRGGETYYKLTELMIKRHMEIKAKEHRNGNGTG